MDGGERNDLVIVLTHYAHYVSGLTNFAKDVAEGLAARGWRVCVVASKHDPELPTHDEIAGVRVVRAPVLAKVGKGTLGVNLARLALRDEITALDALGVRIFDPDKPGGVEPSATFTGCCAMSWCPVSSGGPDGAGPACDSRRPTTGRR